MSQCSTATTASCCAPTSWVRPTASWCCSPAATARCGRWPRACARPSASSASRLEPMSHVALLLYEGRELDIVTQVETHRPFRAIRDDLDRLTKAVDHAGGGRPARPGGGADPRLYQMLVGALRTLAGHSRAARRAGLLLEGAGAARGAARARRAASACGRDRRRWSPSTSTGGVLCRTCRRGVAISPEALDAAAADPRWRAQLALRSTAALAGHPRGRRTWPPGRSSTTSSAASAPSPSSNATDRIGPRTGPAAGWPDPRAGQIGPQDWVSWSNCIQRWPTWSHWM